MSEEPRCTYCGALGHTGDQCNRTRPERWKPEAALFDPLKALSQPAPQGVAEVMALVDAYALAEDGSNREGIEKAIIAIVQERDALKALVAELQGELSGLQGVLNDQNRRLESQLASLREWRRVASQKIDQSDPSAVACFINEVVSASLMYNGSTGPSVGALPGKEAS